MSNATVIPPAPGRVVWYYPDTDDALAFPTAGPQPLAATVARPRGARPA